jgi:hypothetical protein
MVKSVFGSWWIRAWRGGVLLRPLEIALLEAIGEGIPDHMAEVFAHQIAAMNLVQRELALNNASGRAEWRGLRFYRIRSGRVDHAGLPLLPIREGSVRLLRLAVSPGEGGPVLHVSANAIDRRFFDIQCGEDWRPYAETSELVVRKIRQAWRSNADPAGGLGSRGA